MNEKKKPLISIIVPVFKTEQYLDECVSSILNQVLTDFELILVDDGSPDNCPAMCDEWSKKDDRIIVIHKENNGVNSAIIEGVSIANSKYIGFVDSDDWIQPDFFSTLYENMVKYDADCVNSKWTWYEGDGSNYFDCKYRVVEMKKPDIEKKILTPFFEMGVSLYENWSNPRWNKLFKLELLKEIIPLMDKSLHIGEDTVQNLLYLAKCNKIINLIEYSGYMCRVNLNSATRLFNENLIYSNLNYVNSIKKIAKEQNRNFAVYEDFNDGLLSGLVWLSLSSSNRISTKIENCRIIHNKMTKPNSFLKKNLKEFNILIRLGFYLVQNRLYAIGVLYMVMLTKLIKVLKKKGI